MPAKNCRNRKDDQTTRDLGQDQRGIGVGPAQRPHQRVERMTIDSNGIMKDSSTTMNSGFLNGKSNTAKANPAMELTKTPRLTVATRRTAN
jgi:hypothetical protein